MPENLELYIEVRDGKPFNHPMLGSNFRECFPDIDVNNLPPQYARFVRITQAEANLTPGFYEVVDGIYAWNGNAYTDVWSIRPMTQEEKAEKVAEGTRELLDYVEQLTAAVTSVASDDATTPEVKTICQNYLVQLANFTFTDPDPRVTQIPPIPPEIFPEPDPKE